MGEEFCRLIETGWKLHSEEHSGWLVPHLRKKERIIIT
jgi:hypothetical protein